MNDQPSSRQQRLIREAETANAEAWSQWTSDINQRLAEVEVRLIALIGDRSGQVPGVGDPALFGVIAEFVDGERQDRAAAISKIVDALEERLAAEVSTLDERLSERLDSKVFDLGAVRQFRNKIQKLATDLQNDVAENTKIVDARLEALGDQLGALSKRRDIAELSARLGRIERALPPPRPPSIIGWKTEGYEVTPIMSDTSTAPKLDLFPILEMLARDLADTRR
jgi:hypothetical protein